MKLKKALVALVCAAALVTATFLGTMAYFTDQDAVTNTFTVGRVGISLDETNTDGKNAAGEPNEGVARDDGNKYHLIPGQTYIKDPTIHVDAESEDCWLFVVVDNQIEKIEGATEKGKTADQMIANGWSNIGELNKNPVYAYNAQGVAGGNYTVFDKFMIRGEDVTNEVLAPYLNKQIVVTAYAVQAAGFDTALDAWNATFGKVNP